MGFQDVQIFFAVDKEEIMRLDPLDIHQNALDLGRENVHSPDDQHVIAPSADPSHPHHGSSAFAGFGIER